MALAAVSCSNEEVVSVNNDANEIKFAVVSENATRANTTETFCAYKLPDSFHVWACTNTGKSYFQQVEYTKTGDPATWTAPEGNVRFWPNKDTEKLDFYAMRNYGTVQSGYWTPAGTTVKMKTDFQVADNVGDQVDFIYAVATGEVKPGLRDGAQNPNAGQTTLNFRHALSQIVFTAENTNANLAVQITKVAVINVANKGICELPVTATTTNYKDHTGNVGNNDDNIPTPTCTWNPDNLENPGTDYEVETKTCLMKGVTGATDLTKSVDADDATRNFDKSLLLIPQTTTAATISTSNTPTTIKSATDKGSMIAVTCKIWNLNKAGELTDDDVVLYDAVAYIPFAANWKAGKKYIYNLVFGKANGGYDDNGKDVLVPISFNITVDDFTTVVSENIKMEK